jgi:hypothetical protein
MGTDKMLKRINLINILGLFFFSASAFAYDGRELLNAMAVKLAQAKQFSVRVNMTYDVLQDSGQQVQFSEVREIFLKRPGLVRIDTTESDGEVHGLVYNGRSLIKFNVTENVYSVINRPGDVDSIVRYVVSKLGVQVPLARLFVTTLPQEIQKISTQVDYVETNVLAHEPVAHIAGRSMDVDYQLWIGRDRLPRRVVMTYKNEPGQPQFQANFTDWNFSSNIPDGMFRVIPPPDAERIPTLIPANRQSARVENKGGE